MDTLKLVPGDFLKNAGIVGFLRLWEHVKQQRNEQFELTDKIDVQELRNVDLTQAYINTFIEYYGKETNVAKAFDQLDRLIEDLEKKPEEIDQEKIKKDVDSISSNLSRDDFKKPKDSLIFGVQGIEDKIDLSTVIFSDWLDDMKDEIKKEKKISKEAATYKVFVKKQLPKENPDFAKSQQDLLPKLKALQKFCAQPLVKQTFIFKEISHSIIKLFWKNICFLYVNDTKKEISGLIDKVFTKPLLDFLGKKEYKDKSHCIACGIPLALNKEKTSIAFMVDMADDLKRKTSAFWNCKVDAFLCPICTFLYALAPLGFCPVDNGDFVFINANDSVDSLWANNQPKMDTEGKPLAYHTRIDQAILQILESKAKIKNNIQVITRSKLENRYHFNVIDHELIQLTQEKKVNLALKKLVARPTFKMSNGVFRNIYRLCIENLLNYRHQYNLLNMLIIESLKQVHVNSFLQPVLDIQCAQLCAQLSQKENHPMNLNKLQYFASEAGSELRLLLIADKVGQENVRPLPDDQKEDIIRGVVYRLTNALKVRNIEQFVDIIIRLYSSCKRPIPSVFIEAIKADDQFAIVGYAFILGLKGAYYTKENNEGEKNNG